MCFFPLKYSRKLKEMALVAKTPEWLCVASVWHYGKKKGTFKWVLVANRRWRVRSQHDVWVVFTQVSKAADKRQPLTRRPFPAITVLNLPRPVLQHKPGKHKHPQTLYLLQGDMTILRLWNLINWQLHLRGCCKFKIGGKHWDTG